MASSKTRRRNGQNAQSQLRIIAGRWRGRKLTFIPAEGLRPTSDRVRETLFNWLSPAINDARCADLFAGSGALGLEALSRGARFCDFIDTSQGAVRQIGEHLRKLEAVSQGDCHCLSASQYLTTVQQQLDIAFIDPPFGKGLVLPTCLELAASDLLSPQALVYVESPAEEALTNLPSGWQAHREKIAGNVAYRLFTT